MGFDSFEGDNYIVSGASAYYCEERRVLTPGSGPVQSRDSTGRVGRAGHAALFYLRL